MKGGGGAMVQRSGGGDIRRLFLSQHPLLLLLLLLLPLPLSVPSTRVSTGRIGPTIPPTTRYSPRGFESSTNG